MQQHAHLCAQVEERVRAEVRALRLDPMHDGTQVLSIIERIGADVVIGSCGTHEEQPSVASDVAAVVTAVHHSICGFGPLQPFFDDDTIDALEVVALQASPTTVTAVLQAPIRTAFWPIGATITVESAGRLDYVGQEHG